MKRTKLIGWLLLAAILLATPGLAVAGPAPGNEAPAAELAAPTGDPQPPSGRYYVQIDINSSQGAADLAQILPDWDEAFEAGSSTVILTEAEITRVRNRGYTATVVGDAPAVPDVWPACYSHLSELNTWLQVYAADHPTFIDLIDYGDSWCKTQGGCTTPAPQNWSWPGDDLIVARITNELADGPKTGRFFVDAGIHAREIPTPELAKAFIEALVDGYGVDPNATWLLDQREIYVVLSSNPDGRRLVELGAGLEPPYTGNPWYWRKNGNYSYAGSLACAWPPSSGSHYGVDLNRNHIFKWEGPFGGYSTYICDQTFRGSSPASEPEISAYEDFVRSIIPDQRPPGDNDPAPADTTGFLINLHNVTSGVILVPWGWTTANSPNNAQLEAIAYKMSTYNSYGVQHALYPVSGNTRDWAYGELGIPAYVIELYGDDFFTSCGLLPGIISNMLPVLKYASTISDRPYMRVYGPDARNVAANPASVASGAPVNLTAQINDTQNGNQPIAAAEYYVVRPGDAPPGDPGTGTPMAAADGTFNSTVENVQATVDTAGLGRGAHLALVRGLDSGGNWGPFSAQSFTVTCYFADINCSAAVDVTDVMLAAEALQGYWTNGVYDPIFDLNNGGAGDGAFDMLDVQTVAANFGYSTE
ncbi:MAG: M14 family zinc carboxypeptidase [Caldilineales bacterium]